MRKPRAAATAGAHTHLTTHGRKQVGGIQPIKTVTSQEVIAALMRLRDEAHAKCGQQQEGSTRWVLAQGRVSGIDSALNAVADLEIRALRDSYGAL